MAHRRARLEFLHRQLANLYARRHWSAKDYHQDYRYIPDPPELRPFQEVMDANGKVKTVLDLQKYQAELETAIGACEDGLPFDVEGWRLINPVTAATVPDTFDPQDPLAGHADWVSHHLAQLASALLSPEYSPKLGLREGSLHTDGVDGLLLLRAQDTRYTCNRCHLRDVLRQQKLPFQVLVAVFPPRRPEPPAAVTVHIAGQNYLNYDGTVTGRQKPDTVLAISVPEGPAITHALPWSANGVGSCVTQESVAGLWYMMRRVLETITHYERAKDDSLNVLLQLMEPPDQPDQPIRQRWNLC